MSIEYKEHDFASFFKVKDAYADNVHYVSPLKDDLKRMLSEKKNPFFKRGALTYFTALKNNRPVGRIVAHVFHAANQKFNERRGYFGFFDCIDDEEVAQGLLGRAEAFVKSHQCDHISGNFNLNAMQEMGVLIEGDEKPPMLDMLYGPVYLSKLLEGAGYQQEFLMRTSTNERIDTFDVDSVLRDKHKALKASGEFEFRHLRLKEYDQEVQRIRKVLNASMANNPFFVDITEEEMDFQLGPFKAVLDPKLVRIAEKDGEVVAASLSAPD